MLKKGIIVLLTLLGVVLFTLMGYPAVRILSNPAEDMIELKMETSLFEVASFGDKKYSDGEKNLIGLWWGRMQPHVVQRKEDIWAVVWEAMDDPLQGFVYRYQQRFFKDWKWVETTPTVEVVEGGWNYQPSPFFYDQTHDRLSFVQAMIVPPSSETSFQNWVIDPNKGTGELKSELRVPGYINYCGGGIAPNGTRVVAGWCSTEGNVLKYVVIRPDREMIEGPYIAKADLKHPPLYVHVIVDDEDNYYMLCTYGWMEGSQTRYSTILYLHGKVGEEAALVKELFSRTNDEAGSPEMVFCESIEFDGINFHALVRHEQSSEGNELLWIRFDNTGKVLETVELNKAYMKVTGRKANPNFNIGDMTLTQEGLLFCLNSGSATGLLLVDTSTYEIIGKGYYSTEDPYGVWGIELANTVGGNVPRSGEVYGMYVGAKYGLGKAPCQTQYYNIKITWDK